MFFVRSNRVNIAYSTSVRHAFVFFLFQRFLRSKKTNQIKIKSVFFSSPNNKVKMLVVVYLQEAKKYIVVPEEFIYRLDERSLKNYGINSNQKRLIYFSNEVFKNLENKIEMNSLTPNFNAPVTKIFPLPDNLKESCFHGRLYAFESKYFLFFIF